MLLCVELKILIFLTQIFVFIKLFALILAGVLIFEGSRILLIFVESKFGRCLKSKYRFLLHLKLALFICKGLAVFTAQWPGNFLISFYRAFVSNVIIFLLMRSNILLTSFVIANGMIWVELSGREKWLNEILIRKLFRERWNFVYLFTKINLVLIWRFVIGELFIFGPT